MKEEREEALVEEEAPVVDDPMEEDKEEAPVDEDKEEAPMEEDIEEAPVVEDEEEAPVVEDEEEEETPVDEDKEEAPVEEDREEAPVEEEAPVVDDPMEIVDWHPTPRSAEDDELAMQLEGWNFATKARERRAYEQEQEYARLAEVQKSKKAREE